MRIIITESKFNKLVFRYLDGQDWHTWDIEDGEFNVADGEYGKDVIQFRKQPYLTNNDRFFETIYISDDLVTKLTNIFSFNTKDSIESIINWFNQKYNKGLSFEDFEWMEEDYEDEDEDY
jgi:hypothetical protein